MKRKPLIILPILAPCMAAILMDASPLAAVREKMTALAGDAEKIIASASPEKGLSADDLKKIEDIHAGIDALRRTESALEKQNSFADHLGTVPPDERRRVALNAAGLSERDADNIDRFSIRNFIIGQLPGKGMNGIEKELLAEGEKDASGLASEGFHIPRSVLNVMQANRFRNDVTVGGSGTGAEVVTREALRGIIDPFYEAMVVRQLGAQFLSGLQGDIPFPKMGRDSTKPTFKTEVAAAQEITPTSAVVTLSPKRLPAYLEVSKKFLLQTDPSVEAWLRNNLLMEIGVVWEKNVLHGAGTEAPTGLASWSGIGSVAGGTNGLAPTEALIIDLETALGNANAAAGSLAYLTNSRVRGKLKKTPRESGTDASKIWDVRSPGAPLNGYATGVSNCVSNTLTKGSASAVCSAIFFGNWADMVIAQWGGLDVLVNPYSLDTTGMIRISAAAFGDSAVLRSESFSAMLDALTT
jgi:HK97 family phage major capsid protein